MCSHPSSEVLTVPGTRLSQYSSTEDSTTTYRHERWIRGDQWAKRIFLFITTYEYDELYLESYVPGETKGRRDTWLHGWHRPMPSHSWRLTRTSFRNISTNAISILPTLLKQCPLPIPFKMPSRPWLLVTISSMSRSFARRTISRLITGCSVWVMEFARIVAWSWPAPKTGAQVALVMAWELCMPIRRPVSWRNPSMASIWMTCSPRRKSLQPCFIRQGKVLVWHHCQRQRITTSLEWWVVWLYICTCALCIMTQLLTLQNTKETPRCVQQSERWLTHSYDRSRSCH